MAMERCALCGAETETLLWAVHKEKGGIWVCVSCWKKLYERNELVSGSGEAGCGC